MPRKRERLSPLETDVVREIWSSQPVSVANLTEALNSRRRDSPLKRGTVHVLLGRLEEKGWLTRKKEGRGYRYSVTVAEEIGQAELAAEFQAKVFHGSPSALVQCLIRDVRGLKQSEIDSIRNLLDEAERKLKKGNHKKS